MGHSRSHPRRLLPTALVMPMRGVAKTFSGRYPSSAKYKSERPEVRSFPLSRSRVISSASAIRPGPLEMSRS